MGGGRGRPAELPPRPREGERLSGRGAAPRARAAGCGRGRGRGGAGSRGGEHLPAAPALARWLALPLPPARTHRHTPHVSSSSRSAARTHLHFLNEPLDGCQRRGPGSDGREPGRGGRGAGCSERRPGWRRPRLCRRASQGGGRENWEATLSCPGATELTPRPGGGGMTPGLREKAVHAGRGSYSTKATEDLSRCRSRLRFFRCLRAFGYFGFCLVVFFRGNR